MNQDSLRGRGITAIELVDMTHRMLLAISLPSNVMMNFEPRWA